MNPIMDITMKLLHQSHEVRLCYKVVSGFNTFPQAMPSLKPYDGHTKLVVAFDIGTTFSGISYCILEQGQVPEVLGVTR